MSQSRPELSTKDKILASARQLFVEHGFAATSMGKIAQLADVNHSLIFHYFGSKEKLWVAVKESIAQDARQQSKTLPSTQNSFTEFLHQLITNRIQFYRDNPDIVRMINWQRTEHANQTAINATLSTEAQAWLAAFKHYQRTGDIDPKLKVEFIMMFILSIVSSAALDLYVFIKQEQHLEEYIQFCIQRIKKGLQ